MSIKLEKLNKQFKSYDKTIRAVDNITFEFDKKSSVIIGASGSGKTTLLDLVGLLLKPDSGSIIFDNQDITILSDEKKREFIKDNIGYIFQSYNLIDSLTVKENIFLGLHKKIDQNLFEKITKKLNLSSLLNKYPNQLSGGQKQKCAISRAILKKPKLLLADEPTGALDVKSTAEVIDLIFDLQKSFEYKIIMVTHDISLISNFESIIKYRDGLIIND